MVHNMTVCKSDRGYAYSLWILSSWNEIEPQVLYRVRLIHEAVWKSDQKHDIATYLWKKGRHRRTDRDRDKER